MRVELDLEKIKMEIYKSFGYSLQQVFDQIKADFPRMLVSYNGETITLANFWSSKLPLDVMLLCTQASFFYLFDEIYKRFTVPGQLVVAGEDTPVVRICSVKGNHKLFFKKSFRILNSKSLTALCVVHTYAIINNDKMTIVIRE